MRYQVSLAKPRSYAILDLQGSPHDLSGWPATAALEFPSNPNSFVASGSLTLCWVGREHWLLMSEQEHESTLLQTTGKSDMPGAVSVVDISDTLAFFGVRGHDADQVLSIASPLDVHRSVFPENGVSYTEVFGLKALVIRRTGGFEFGVDCSYSDMMEDYLRRAVPGEARTAQAD